ncbi:MAG TPA: 2-C-methyl-D-erythritol 4-phosphate cytidylyltransferase [Clostridiales bacterium]|nr:2-C-methyl-D-erythritol 4-phosphate cytidylyltransferase [Clostridiales bacterium]
MGKNKVVIFAGGVGERMKYGKPKQFIELMHRPIIAETISHFQNNELIDEIYVVITEGYEDKVYQIKENFNFTKIKKVINGGKTAMQSIYFGLVAASENLDSDDIVLIHDGVRPLITDELITKNINICRENGSCVSVGKMVETPILLEGEYVSAILDRNATFVAKAPQTFYLKEIKEAHEKMMDKPEIYNTFVDNCSLAKYLGYKINITFSSSQNIKVTTKTDVYKMIGILNGRDYEKLLTE